jgi:hypothetical protein
MNLREDPRADQGEDGVSDDELCVAAVDGEACALATDISLEILSGNLGSSKTGSLFAHNLIAGTA